MTCCCNRSQNPMSDVRRTPEERAVIDRLQRLSVLLPALAQEAATARREAARLRVENRRLTRRLAEAESLTLVASLTATNGQT
jgi:regulator of replication initiation timing